MSEAVVHAEEKIETRSMEVEQPSEAHAECTGRSIDRSRQTFCRCDIGRQAEVGPRVCSVDTGSVEQAERKTAIEREGIFGADVERCGKRSLARALITEIVKFIQSGEIVLNLIPFTIRIVDIERIFVSRERTRPLSRSKHIVAPVDKTEIEYGGRECEVTEHRQRRLIDHTEIDSKTIAPDTCAVDIGTTDITMVVMIVDVGLICQSFELRVNLRVGCDGPGVSAQGKICVMETSVDISGADKELGSHTDTPLLVYVM